MKKIFAMFIFILLANGLLFSICTYATGDGISVWPPDITITINDWDYEKEIHQKIIIENLNSYDIYVTAVVENPIPYRLTPGYENITDLYWVKLEPEIIFIPAHESSHAEVFISIPEEKKQYHYNENWEVWLVFSESKDPNSTLFLIELAVKCFINTPSGQVKSETPIYPFIVLFSIIGGLAIIKLYIFFKKEQSKSAVFYNKKKK